MALLTDQPRTASVIAVTDLMLLSLSAADLEAVLNAFPTAGVRIEAAAKERLRAIAKSDGLSTRRGSHGGLSSLLGSRSNSVCGSAPFGGLARRASRSNSLTVKASPHRRASRSHSLSVAPGRQQPEPPESAGGMMASHRESVSAQAQTTVTSPHSTPKLEGRRVRRLSHRIISMSTRVAPLAMEHPTLLELERRPSLEEAMGDHAFDKSIAGSTVPQPVVLNSSDHPKPHQRRCSLSMGSLNYKTRQGFKTRSMLDCNESSPARLPSGAEATMNGRARVTTTNTKSGRRGSQCSRPPNLMAAASGGNAGRRRSVDAGLNLTEQRRASCVVPAGAVILPGVPTPIPSKWASTVASRERRGSANAPPLPLALRKSLDCGWDSAEDQRRRSSLTGKRPAPVSTHIDDAMAALGRRQEKHRSVSINENETRESLNGIETREPCDSSDTSDAVGPLPQQVTSVQPEQTKAPANDNEDVGSAAIGGQSEMDSGSLSAGLDGSEELKAGNLIEQETRQYEEYHNVEEGNAQKYPPDGDATGVACRRASCPLSAKKINSRRHYSISSAEVGAGAQGETHSRRTSLSIRGVRQPVAKAAAKFFRERRRSAQQPPSSRAATSKSVASSSSVSTGSGGSGGDADDHDRSPATILPGDPDGLIRLLRKELAEAISPVLRHSHTTKKQLDEVHSMMRDLWNEMTQLSNKVNQLYSGKWM